MIFLQFTTDFFGISQQRLQNISWCEWITQGEQLAVYSLLRKQVYISREIDIFSNKEAKELIMELKSISSRQVGTGII